ncbi:type I-F CRISPR-associated protein Csy3 [Formicincola oecophyllae]|uniref:Type I-F CRISPR-associated protein Csy3 n=1 Tax=Formicincola oecophyllae TaxID=2558361 RepID=A0A4Y6UAS1_9PROT|nr:type I-F CRISPR-associated protein Csy3 [Formicincola oecophyllae]QDH13225.1 type I-F CRISPR-associated protein Csy3 [Formicincola oecophyllae]
MAKSPFLPSVLAFERKLAPSDALFLQGEWSKRQEPFTRPVVLNEKSVRGTISNRDTKEEDCAKPNLQTVDNAALDPECDTLKVVFTLRVLPGLATPSACNSLPYAKKLQEAVQQCLKQKELDEVGRRYAANLANGRFLWRNRLGAQEVAVKVTVLGQDGKPVQSWDFNALDQSLKAFPAKGTDPKVDELGSAITKALAGGQALLLQVEAWVCLGAGQDVFPSQELILKADSSKEKKEEKKKGGKSRVLYQVAYQGGHAAGMHSQKLGNAIRTIDTWYPHAEENGNRPIAVEPYGAVTVQGHAWRAPKDGKRDFYNLIDNWMEKDKVPEETDRQFVMAVLIRGGVFGGKE